MTYLLRHLRRRLISVLVVSGIVSCMQGGSGSTTTNGLTASIKTDQGEFVPNAVVRIRPHDYCAPLTPYSDDEGERSIVDTFTGNDGSISVNGLHPGLYTIEVIDVDKNTGVLIHGEVTAGNQTDLGSWTVAPCGALTGSIDTALMSNDKTFSVQVYGLERRIPVDRSTGRFIITSLPPDTYTVRLIADDTTFEPVDFKPTPLFSEDTIDIDPFSTWTHFGTVSIDPTAAGLSPHDTLYNVPLALILNADNFNFSPGKRKGGDLRVTKTDGSAVFFESEWYDSNNTTATIWVLVDTLYGNHAVNTLHLYSGNREMLSLSNPPAVFDTAFGYRGVWHFNESGGTPQFDATINNHNAIPSATMAGENDRTQHLGRCQWFKSDDEYITIDNLCPSATYDGDFSLVAWIKDSTDLTTESGIFSCSDNRFGLLHNTQDRWVFYRAESTDSCFASIPTKDWVLLAAVVHNNRCYLYVNGIAVDSCESILADGEEKPSDTSTLFIGCNSDTTAFFRGVLDDVQFHTIALSPHWIRFCYETQRPDQEAVSITWKR